MPPGRRPARPAARPSPSNWTRLARLVTDAERLRSVLVNLLSNAQQAVRALDVAAAGPADPAARVATRRSRMADRGDRPRRPESPPTTCRGCSSRSSRRAAPARVSAWPSRATSIEGLGGVDRREQPGRAKAPRCGSICPAPGRPDWRQRMTRGIVLLVDDEPKILRVAGDGRCATKAIGVTTTASAREALGAREPAAVRSRRRGQPHAGDERPRPHPRDDRGRERASGRRS